MKRKRNYNYLIKKVLKKLLKKVLKKLLNRIEYYINSAYNIFF